MRQEYYLPLMVIDVHNTVRRRVSCAKDRIDLRKHTSLLNLFPAQAPVESVVLDPLGPLPNSKPGYRLILVMIYRFTTLYRFKALRSTTAPTIAQAFCEEKIIIYGPSTTLLTENGPQLTSEFLEDSCRFLGTKIVYTTAYYLQTNSQTERLNRALCSMLRHYVVDDQ